MIRHHMICESESLSRNLIVITYVVVLGPINEQATFSAVRIIATRGLGWCMCMCIDNLGIHTKDIASPNSIEIIHTTIPISKVLKSKRTIINSAPLCFPLYPSISSCYHISSYRYQ